MQAHAFRIVLLGALLTGCAAASVKPPAASPMPGSDRDAHGCIPSAGYAWCTRTKHCERPWELAEAKGFANTAEAFEGYCKKEQP